MDELINKDQADRWDKYVEDKPELKEIIANLAQGLLFLKLELENLLVSYFFLVKPYLVISINQNIVHPN